MLVYPPMSLFEINYSAEQRELFEYLENIRVVTETVILNSDEPVEGIYQYSKLAAVKGMGILAVREDHWFRKDNPQAHIEQDAPTWILPGEELAGEVITFAEFIGDPPAKMESYAEVTTQLDRGFAYALLDTPYGLSAIKKGRPSTEEYINEQEFYNDVLTDYLKTILNITDYSNTLHLTFVRWSDNWSDYFDAGKEWWGSFCWTVYNSENNHITFIAASATD